MNCDFVIKNPLWARVCAWLAAAIGLIIVTVTTIVYFTSSIPYKAFVTLESVSAFIAGLGLVGGYIGIVEKFELRGGVFTYTKPFKKRQSAAVEEIEKVVIHGLQGSRFISNIVFYSKDGKKLIHFLDDGTAFQGGKFELALIELKIPFQRY